MPLAEQIEQMRSNQGCHWFKQYTAVKERGTLSFILFSIFDTEVGFVGVRTWRRQNRQANSTNTKLSVLSLMSDTEEGGSLDSGVVAHNFRSFLTLLLWYHSCMHAVSASKRSCPLPFTSSVRQQLMLFSREGRYVEEGKSYYFQPPPYTRPLYYTSSVITYHSW